MSNFSQFFGSAAGTGFPIGAAVDVFGNGYDDATWLKANGRVVPQADYPALYQSIGILASSMGVTSKASATAPAGSTGWSYEGDRTNRPQAGAVAASDANGLSFGMMARSTTNSIVGLSSVDGVTWTTTRADWPQYKDLNSWGIGGYRKGVFTGLDVQVSNVWNPSYGYTQYVVWSGASMTLYSLPSQLYARSCAANSNYYYLMVRNNAADRLELYRGAYGAAVGSTPIWQSAGGDGPIDSWAVVGSHVYIAWGGSFVSTDNGDSFSNAGAVVSNVSSTRGFQAAVNKKVATSVILVENGATTSEVALPSDFPAQYAGTYFSYVEAGYLYLYAGGSPTILRRKPLSNLSATWELAPGPANFVDGGYYPNGASHIQAGNFWFSNLGRVLHVPEYRATQASPQVLRYPFVLASLNSRHFAMGWSQTGATAPLELLELTAPYDDATLFQIPNAVSADPLKTTMIRAR